MKKNRSDYVQLSQLTDMSSPEAVFEEVKCNFIRFYHITEFFPVRAAFRDFNGIYAGRHPGYKCCNTKYHDVSHVTDALLALSRLIDGYNIENKKRRFTARETVTALIAAIFHDSGYIQRAAEKKGTGAKYTLCHVKRSEDFVTEYYKTCGYPREDAALASRIIECTGLNPDLKKINFRSRNEKILGCMMGTADLTGQMASRNYLEKLIFLYREFKEGHVKGFKSEFDLLEKTFNFYSKTEHKLSKTFLGVERFASVHFREVYGIDLNIYTIAIREQINYLDRIITRHRKDYRSMLRRSV